MSTASLLERFERDGFVVVEDAIDPDACLRLGARADELVEAVAPQGPVSVFTTEDQTRTSDEYFLGSGEEIRAFFEPEALDAEGHLTVDVGHAVNKLGHAMHDLDPVFDAFSRAGEMVGIARELGVEAYALIQSMFIFKHPRIGGEVTCHTDDTFLWTEPRSCVGFWVAIDDATTTNGAMWALPGGHRLPVRRRFRRAGPTDADGTEFEVFDPEPYPTDDMVPLEASRGTVVVLDGRLPHLSGPNRSDRPRRAYTVHVIDPTARYPEDGWLRRERVPLRDFRS